jgi:hypothetical protein
MARRAGEGFFRIPSALHEDQRRRFEQRLEPLDEHRRVPAVDHAMVERRRQVHHLARHELRAVPHRPDHHLVDADNRHFRMLITGVVTMPPIAPSDVMVMVEPVSSSRVAVPNRHGRRRPGGHLPPRIPQVARLGMFAPPARPGPPASAPRCRYGLRHGGDDAGLVVEVALICGCSAIALTMARIRKGRMVSFGRSARFSPSVQRARSSSSAVTSTSST